MDFVTALFSLVQWLKNNEEVFDDLKERFLTEPGLRSLVAKKMEKFSDCPIDRARKRQVFLGRMEIFLALENRWKKCRTRTLPFVPKQFVQSSAALFKGLVCHALELCYWSTCKIHCLTPTAISLRHFSTCPTKQPAQYMLRWNEIPSRIIALFNLPDETHSLLICW